jgi:phosphohistidine phosphatase
LVKLAIVRHGKAEDRAPSGADRDRALAARGHNQAEWVAAELAAIFRPPDVPERLILTSDFARALSTAREIEAAVACPLWTEETLQTGHDARSASRLLQRHAHLSGLILVGHNPQLSELLDLLVPSSLASDALRTGEAAILEVDAGYPPASGKLLDRLRLDD